MGSIFQLGAPRLRNKQMCLPAHLPLLLVNASTCLWLFLLWLLSYTGIRMQHLAFQPALNTSTLQEFSRLFSTRLGLWSPPALFVDRAECCDFFWGDTSKCLHYSSLGRNNKTSATPWKRAWIHCISSLLLQNVWQKQLKEGMIYWGSQAYCILMGFTVAGDVRKFLHILVGQKTEA